MANADKPITLKRVVDKIHNKVVFVEADNDFVDILVSFLTMPLGTIIRLCCNGNDYSSIGAIGNLYKSVKSLDAKYFNTKECKSMLLHPHNASFDLCKRLKLNADDSPDVRYNMCLECNRFSSLPSVRCACGELMTKELNVPINASILKESVFMKGMGRYIVGDDLTICRASTSNALRMFHDAGINLNEVVLEETDICIGRSEILRLLHQAFSSISSLSETLLLEYNIAVPDERCNTNHGSLNVEEKEDINTSESITIKLFVDRTKKKVLYAECEQDFVDLLFNLLTFPLGLVLKHIKDYGIGRIHKLYRSVEKLSQDGLLRDELCNQKLLKPKLPKHFSCSKSIKLKLTEEEDPPTGVVITCLNDYCNNYNKRVLGLLASKRQCRQCRHVTRDYLHLINPKVRVDSTHTEDGFCEMGNYMVTDEVEVSRLSSYSGLAQLLRSNLVLQDLEEVTVRVGQPEVVRLMEALMTSKTALTDAFL